MFTQLADRSPEDIIYGIYDSYCVGAAHTGVVSTFI